MPEKCKGCGYKIKSNKEGFLCPTCGDYFCYNCSKDTEDPEEKGKKSVICPGCNEFVKYIWPL